MFFFLVIETQEQVFRKKWKAAGFTSCYEVSPIAFLV